jgi:hypothetical protein
MGTSLLILALCGWALALDRTMKREQQQQIHEFLHHQR